MPAPGYLRPPLPLAEPAGGSRLSPPPPAGPGVGPRLLLHLLRHFWRLTCMGQLHRLSAWLCTSLTRAPRQGASLPGPTPPAASLLLQGRHHFELARVCSPHAPFSGAERDMLRSPP
ncbi:hypothetical protein NDU88_012576 [Pleurodeles waltl]|uniref:Uncharacterized protein n=1 Tax=Pleurodeles waltl TaxID=8319 RepID=A0AAV7R6C5_PLEWA|nr:hypothetical protein NDU88_012576 [Pleurodeles waltl]